MFVGIDYYGTTYGNRPYKREMGETPEDMARAVKWQEEQEAKARGHEYRGREIGEKPWEVPSREQQGDYYQKAQREVPSYQSRPTYESRPREIGETPEDVAKAEARQKENRPKRWDEMTEQERRIDMYA